MQANVWQRLFLPALGVALALTVVLHITLGILWWGLAVVFLAPITLAFGVASAIASRAEAVNVRPYGFAAAILSFLGGCAALIVLIGFSH